LPIDNPSSLTAPRNDDAQDYQLGGGVIESPNVEKEDSQFINLFIPSVSVEEIVLKTQTVIEDPAFNLISKSVAGIGIVSGGVAVSSALALGNLALTDFFFLPLKLWILALSALGLRRKNRPWGTVYDSITKRPIDPAYLHLFDHHGKQVAEALTDRDGRYGFLVPPGQYRLTVERQNYAFPSQTMLAKLTDEMFDNLYFGEMIDVGPDGMVTKNIPLDPLRFDWNEFIKKQKKLNIFTAGDVFLNSLIRILFTVGLIVSAITVILSPTIYNFIIVGLYLLFLILQSLGLSTKKAGLLKDKTTNLPLSFALIKVYLADHDMEIAKKVADQYGHYYCLVPKGEYYVKVFKKTTTGYEEVLTSGTLRVENGIINQTFAV
jgi:hypothetical protein